MAKYIPFPAYPDFAPLDISYLFEDEKPAGKHGFLTARGDRFVFEDGTPVRFWGANLNAGACFPEKDHAPKLAKRLAAYGCNIVRLHQMDAEWAIPSIYQCRRGKRLQDTCAVDPESMDRLDWLLHCLKQEGIYVFLDMLTYRKFKEADGVRSSAKLRDRAAPYCLFDPTLISLQKDYCTLLWEHVNPYTGLAWKDDPMFALCEPVNEVCLFGGFNQKITVEPYVSEFRELYRTWCRENAPTEDVDGADLNDNGNETLCRFKIHVTESYFHEMFAHMRSLGVRVPFAGNNFSWTHYPCKSSARVGDFMDTHVNMRYMSWSPGNKVYRDLPPHALGEWGAARGTRMRQFGKPFFMSEWDLTYPIDSRAEGTLLLSAIGGLQNWSGFCVHTYAYTSFLEYSHTIGKEVSCETIGGTGYREGVFSTWNDPAKFGIFYHAAIITRRGDVQPAKNKYTVRVDDVSEDDLHDAKRLNGMKKRAFWASAERSQIAADYFGTCPEAISERTELVDPKAGFVRSDTGELLRSWEKGYGIIDTPKTQAIYGALGCQGTVQTDTFRVTCQNDYAVLALSSLENDRDISESGSMLLTVEGKVQNTGFTVRNAPGKEAVSDGLPPHLEVLDNGKPPILCEVVEAQVSIRTSRKNLVVWAVSAEGIFVGNVPVTYRDGWAHFTLGQKSPSIYYLIQAE